MSKRSFITNITPIDVSRKTALAMLHDHAAMIELNPLVVRHQTTKPPPTATLEEQVNCIWYEITDAISYLPGGYMKSELSYKGGFYDLPDGLQTHVFAPAGVDLRGLWKVGGTMPGERPEPVELGVNVPKSGLYLREDVEVTCNFLLMSFVVRNLKKSHGELVQRWLAKAHQMEQAERQRSSNTSTTNTRSPPRLNVGHSRPSYGQVSNSASSDVSQLSSTGQGVSRRKRVPEHDYSAHQGPRSLVPSQASPANVSSGQRSESFGFGQPLPPDPPSITESYSYRTPQLFGEQAELPATTQYVREEDNWPDAPPSESISGPKNAANGEILELDSSEVAYWKQQQFIAEA